jgi:hypothetical protein
MIDEDVKEGIKETIVSSVYKHQRGDSDLGSDSIDEELNDRLLASEEVEEFRAYADLVRITLAREYPGVVPIPDSSPEELARLVREGFSDAEIKKNVARFYLWDAFRVLKKSPKGKLFQWNAYRRIMQSKKHDIAVDPDGLLFLLGAMGEPTITEKQLQQLKAAGEVEALGVMYDINHTKASEMYWEYMQDKSDDGDELNSIESVIAEKEDFLAEDDGAMESLKWYFRTAKKLIE